MSENPFDEPTDDSASDFFGSGSPSCRFNNIGDMHQGTITKFEEAQQRDLKTKLPAHWPDGNKKMMLVVTLQTNERDAEIEDDNGERKLYVNKPSGMFAAIRAAIGKEKFAVGGTLAVKYTKNGKPPQAGFNAPKEYVAKYVPPGGAAAPSPNGHAWQNAVVQCDKVGVDADTLKARLKNAGVTSSSDPNFDKTVKEIIANARGESPFEGKAEAVFTEDQIPF